MVVWTTCQTFLDPDARFVALCLGALVCIVSLWGIALAIISFWKFKFLPADWIESTDTPTDDFARRMGWELPPKDESTNVK